MYSRSCLFEKKPFDRFITAVSNGDINTVNTLLKQNRDNQQFEIDKTSGGRTALQIALQNHDLPIAAKLIHAGANTQIEHTTYISDPGSWTGGYEEKKHIGIININKFDFARLIQLISDEATCQHKPLESSLRAIV